MNYPRKDHALVIGADGKVYAFGGENGAGTAILHPEVWDPDSEAWTVFTPMDSGGQAYHPRKYHSTALLFKNAEFITGGERWHLVCSRRRG